MKVIAEVVLRREIETDNDAEVIAADWTLAAISERADWLEWDTRIIQRAVLMDPPRVGAHCRSMHHGRCPVRVRAYAGDTGYSCACDCHGRAA